MKILGCRSSQIGSKFIRWATGEDISHIALELSNGFVIHSTHAGVEVRWGKHFREEHEVVYEAQYMGFMGEPQGLIAQLMESEGRPYDWLLFLTMGLNALHIPVPELDTPSAFICTEIVSEYIFGTGNKYTPGQIIDKLAALPTWDVRRIN